jgi:hypothetical protein
MSFRGRFRKLERSAPAPDARRADPQFRHWRLYYEAALEVLEPYPEARQEVVRRVELNEPLIFRPDWQRTVTGADSRFYWCKETRWAALGQFPAARQAWNEVVTMVCAARRQREAERRRGRQNGHEAAPPTRPS